MLRKVFFYLAFCLLVTAACTSSRQIVYLNDIADSLRDTLAKSRIAFESPIQKNDLLSIKINSLNPQDLVLVNPNSSQTSTSAITVGTAGFLVNGKGEIQLPLIGKFKAEGLTRVQLEAEIETRMKDFIKDPVVQVRFINNNVTVLGDVLHPQQIPMITERLTVMEALGICGDLKVTGKRENIKIIRESNGKRSIGTLDITSKNIFKSPYFYLKPYDVVYVEPIRASYISRSNSATQYVIAASGVVGLILSIILLVKK